MYIENKDRRHASNTLRDEYSKKNRVWFSSWCQTQAAKLACVVIDKRTYAKKWRREEKAKHKENKDHGSFNFLHREIALMLEWKCSRKKSLKA